MRTKRYTSRVVDFSGGLISGVSDYASRPRHYVVAENVEWRPHRACQVRPGTQRASSGTLTKRVHSLMEHIVAPGTSEIFEVCDDGAAGEINILSGAAHAPQALPFTISPTSKASWAQLNGALWMAQRADGVFSRPPLVWGAVPASGFLTSLMATPTSTLTLTPGAGGNMANAAFPGVTYWYRVRHRFGNGTSKASTPQSVAMISPNATVAVTTIPVSARADYLGWTLERTKEGGSATGPFYFVADGTGASYNTPGDTFSDGDLGYEVNDIIHEGVPNGHVDGLIAHNNRLLGWTGSTLYASQEIGDLQATGLYNWDARNAYDFGKDDGDEITCCVPQNDRLVVIKQNSVWALEGDGPDSYRVILIFRGAGAAGLRAADSMGSLVWFNGAAGLHQLSGNTVRPFGYVEINDILNVFSAAKLDDVVIRNHAGQRLIIAFSRGGVINDDVLVYDARFGNWARWTGIYAEDILVDRGSTFGDAGSFLYADPRDRIDPGAGTDYRTMIGYYGYGDEREADGSGGVSVRVRLRSPWIDDGMPDTYKSFERFGAAGFGTDVTVSVTVETDPPSVMSVRHLVIPGNLSTWGGGATWGGGEVWGGAPGESAVEAGLDEGLFGRRYRVTIECSASRLFTFNAYWMDCIAQPERRYSR